MRFFSRVSVLPTLDSVLPTLDSVLPTLDSVLPTLDGVLEKVYVIYFAGLPRSETDIQSVSDRN